MQKGDKIAIVSLSSGVLGEDFCRHELEIALNRLKCYGLIPVVMPNALKGIEYLKNHPEKRADDLKSAFSDKGHTGGNLLNRRRRCIQAYTISYE